MAYIWINPVTENMYDPAALDAFLKQHRFKRVYASSHWLDTVKEKYKQAVKTADHTVIDMRCPKIIHLIDAYDLRESVTIPNIIQKNNCGSLRHCLFKGIRYLLDKILSAFISP